MVKTMFCATLGLCFILAAPPLLAQQAVQEPAPAPLTSRQAALKRVTDGIRFLASDELKGRKPGTEGIEKAAQFIENEYRELGLKTLSDGTYRQAFKVTRGRIVIADQTALTLAVGDDSIELKYGQDYLPQLGNKGYEVSGNLVFVGYGISADDFNYDEYRDLDVEGKIVVLIRREPQQNDPDSVFDGKQVSPYAYIQNKVNQARKANAAAILMVNDGVTAVDDDADRLAQPNEFGIATRRIPFIHVKRRVIDQLLEQSPIVAADGTELKDLATIEKRIDETLEPLSAPLAATASIKAAFGKDEVETYNMVGIIEGEGPLADETIIIGGHYDHLGMGGFGSRAPGRNEVHNGADDNATGTMAVLELARHFAQRSAPPKRRMVFICFSAEEMGLLGAQHYVENPLFPLDQTVAMINFDMIGWLRDDKLTAFNWNSANAFGPALDRANADIGLNVVKPTSGFGGSDHLPFFMRKIPVMFLHTGLTSTYHTPEDDFETINCEGALRVIEFSERLLEELVDLEQRPRFVDASAGPKRLRLGVSLDSDHEKGAEITRIRSDSLAAKTGLEVGDVIMQIGDKKIDTRRDVAKAINEYRGKSVSLKIFRDEKEISLTVELKND